MVSSFVGRAADVDGILARFESGARLVTVTGPGGMGKTRVAVRFAEAAAKRYSARRGAGAWFCDLSSATSLTGLVAAVASMLDVALVGRTDEELVASLGRALTAKGRMLVVLDNLEQLVTDAASAVSAWLRQAPYLDILATSRIPLGVPGEAQWPLEALSLEDASQLFLERVRDVSPELSAHAPTLAVVADIVSTLDRMPLAIELAASRMAVLSAEGLRDRLRHPLDVLVKPRDETRHGSMRATILGSLELLSRAERQAFAYCSVFRGGFTLAAAEAVLGPRALAEVEALRRSSLLRASRDHADLRFRFFEVVREVAVELGRSEPALGDAETKHVRFYADLVGRLGDDATIHELSREQDNLLVAHERALSLAAATGDAKPALSLALGLVPILRARRIPGRRLDLLSETLALVQRDGACARSGDAAALMVAHGLALREAGDVTLALSALEAGKALAHESSQSGIAAEALLRIGEIVEVSGRTDRAHACFAEALGLLARAAPTRRRTLQEAEAHLFTGHAYRREGDLVRAEAAIARALARYRQAGDDEGLASALYEAAVVAMFEGARERALARFDEGLAIARKASLDVVGAQLTTACGCLLQELGRVDDALKHHAEAARVFRDLGLRYRETSALYYLATAYLDAGDAAGADAILGSARERGHAVGAPRYEALIAGAQAIALARLGDVALAEAALANADAARAACESEPCLTATLAIHRLTLGLRVPGADVTASLAEASARVQANPSDDTRFAERMLLAEAKPELRATPAALVVELDAQAFRLPHARDSVDLSRRAPLRAIVSLLAERRLSFPGELVSVDDVLAAAWPGERIRPDAAMNRAYVAMATLRKLGLRDVLVSGGGGYMLSPGVPLVFRRATP